MRRSHPHVHEVAAAPLLYALTQQEGHPIGLGQVPARVWDEIAALGVDYVWLMGVWRKSQEATRIARARPELRPAYDAALPGWTDADVVGSPYAIAAYEPDPALGSWDDLRAARASLERRGMGLLLDFVPNHLAPDHPWVSEHPERFVLGAPEHVRRDPGAFLTLRRGEETLYVAKGRDPFFPPWHDTVQLDHFAPWTREALVEQLALIAEHCDGVRCDMAMLLLNDVFERTWGAIVQNPAPATEFWAQARAAVPGLLLCAEAYWDTEYRLHQLGFDFAYDKRLYDRCLGGSAESVRQHLGADLEFQSKLVRFVENHDERRAAAAFGPRLRPASVLCNTLPGMRLSHEGQRDGLRVHRPVQLRRVREETPDADFAAWFERLLGIAAQPVFHEGRWSLCEVQREVDNSAGELIAYEWRSEIERRLVVVNLGAGCAQGRIRLEGVEASVGYALHDELDDAVYLRDGAELGAAGLHVVLPPMGSHVFDLRRAE